MESFPYTSYTASSSCFLLSRSLAHSLFLLRAPEITCVFLLAFVFRNARFMQANGNRLAEIGYFPPMAFQLAMLEFMHNAPDSFLLGR